MKPEELEMRLARWILALLVFGALWIPGGAKATTFTADEQATLERGEVVKQPLGADRNAEGVLGGASYVVVDASPDVVWRAMQDVDAYTSIFPRTLSVEVISDRGTRKVLKFVQGTSILQISFYAQFKFNAEARKAEWSMMTDQPHDLESTSGYFQVEAYGDGKSLVTHVSVVDLGDNAALLALASQIQGGLLNVPGNLRDWVQGPHGDEYRDEAATTED